MKIGLAVLAVVASAAPAFAASCCGVYHPGTASARDQLLATPAPRQANRVESTTRSEHGRVWVPGARYGADVHDHSRVIYARRDHTIIALNPWRDVRGDSRVGFDDLERARNQWLREQGYVQSVRTHVHPSRLDDGGMEYRRELPTPRATIKRIKQVRTPEKPVAYLGAESTDQIRARLELADAE